MTAKINPDDRDSVLYAFHEECARPTAKQIVEWVNCYPQFADEIRAHASVALELAMHVDEPEEQPDESLLARGYSQALNALYDADHPIEQLKEEIACGLSKESVAAYAAAHMGASEWADPGWACCGVQGWESAELRDREP